MLAIASALPRGSEWSDPQRSLVIGELVTNEPTQGAGGPLGIIVDAAIVVDGADIAWVGSRADAPDADVRVRWDGAAVVPGFVDSHAHLVFAGDRSKEFAARMSGEPYGAGGIAATVAATRAADDATLRANVERLAGELLRAGVTTFETKSGYGLTVADEARALRIAGSITDEATFLGAHIVPAEFDDDRDGYVDLVAGPMLQACAPLAAWIDVFCDRGAFEVDEARHMTAGMAAGLTPRLHAGQLGLGAGIQLAVELSAASVDHSATPPRPTSMRSPAPPRPKTARSPPCCLVRSSPPVRAGPTGGGYSMPV